MKNSLFQLINSLSTAEKRQFKIYANYKKGDSKYNSLFDAINKQDSYDELKLIKKFNYSANPNGFSVAKNHLFSSIMAFLRSKKKQHSPINLIIRNLSDIETFYDHKLYAESLSLVNKTIKIAQDYQADAFLPILGHWKLRLAFQCETNEKMHLTYSEGVEIKSTSLARLNNERIYFSIYEKLFFENCIHGFAKKGEALDRSMALKNSIYLQDIEKAESTSAKLAFYLSKIEVAKSEFNLKKQIDFGRKVHNLLTNFEIKNPILWLIGITEYLESILLNDLEEEFDKSFMLLQEFPIPEYFEDMVRKKEMCLLFIETLSASVFPSKKLEGTDITKRGLDYFEKHKTTFNNRHELKYLYHTAKYFYWIGDSKTASTWIYKLLSVLDRSYFIDCYLMTSFIFGTTQFDLGNFESLEKNMPRFRKFLLTTGRMTPTEAFLYKAFNKLLTLSYDKSARREAFKALRTELKTIAKYTNSHTVIDLKEAILWTESKLKNKPMMELYYEQYRPIAPTAKTV